MPTAEEKMWYEFFRTDRMIGTQTFPRMLINCCTGNFACVLQGDA